MIYDADLRAYIEEALAIQQANEGKGTGKPTPDQLKARAK